MKLLIMFVLLILMQVSLGDFYCDICVIQPLLTSDVVCPLCTTLDGGNNEDLWDPQEDFESKRRCPIEWKPCNVTTPTCNASDKYRSFDGSCNNLDHPTWGITATPFTRLLPSYYRDSKHLLRLGKRGDQLPLVRTLSTTFFRNADRPDTVTLMAMQWGQIVAHDISLSLPLQSPNCCNSLTYNEELCLAFRYPSTDYFYSQFNVTCDTFARNQHTLVGENCQKGPAQQRNFDSHPIDGSLVYGSDAETANSFRTFDNGRIKTRKLDDGREFLTNVPPGEEEDFCYLPTPGEPCYTAGDLRVNQNTELSVLVTILQRAHNNIAGKLQKIHGDWSDEILYQESRRILVAILQHIHYKEWLKFYIGESAMREYNLYPKKYGYTEYNSEINFMNINSFATAAFRVGHSGMQGILDMYNHGNVRNGSIVLTDWMDRPLVIEQDRNYDKFVLGLVNQRMQKFDKHMAFEVSNLISRQPLPYGKDLVSMDILRGRDHGLAPYVHYLQICTGFKATSFESLKEYIQPQSVELLRRHYRSFEDIDLMVGGTLEKHVDDSRLGPTFLCIFVEQFYRLKWGDRFWYEVEGQPHSFTEEQLQEIRKMTVSKLLCDNGDQIQDMPSNSFLPVSKTNRMKNCRDIPGINFKKF